MFKKILVQMAGAPGAPGAAAAGARQGRGAGTTRSLDLVTTTTTTTWSLDLVTGAARKPRPSNVQQVEADSFADLCNTTFFRNNHKCSYSDNYDYNFATRVPNDAQGQPI